MARPIKQTIDYFPHDANASEGKTVYILDNEYGNDGYACWFRLLELLCRTKGQFLEIQDGNSWQYLAAKLRVKEDLLKQILRTLADTGAIDKELHGSGIIWSQNLIDNLDDVYKRRSCEKPEKPDNVNNNTVIDNNNSIDVINNRVSRHKQNKTILNKTILNNNNSILPEWIDKSLWDDFLVMRKKIKATPTDRAIELLVKTLDDFRSSGVDPNKILEQSIMNGWKGLFPLKDSNNGKTEQHPKTRVYTEPPDLPL